MFKAYSFPSEIPPSGSFDIVKITGMCAVQGGLNLPIGNQYLSRRNSYIAYVYGGMDGKNGSEELYIHKELDSHPVSCVPLIKITNIKLK